MIKPVISISGIILLLLWITWLAHQQTNERAARGCRDVWVQTIGGCDRDGWCAVRYSNGEKDKLQYPVTGDEVCK